VTLREVVERRAFASMTNTEDLLRVYLRPAQLGAPLADVDLSEALRGGDVARVVISGNPGSGKTSLIAKVLADLPILAPQQGHEALILSVGDPSVFASDRAFVLHLLQTLRVQEGRFSSVDPEMLARAAAVETMHTPAQLAHRSGMNAPVVSYQLEVKEAVDAFRFDTAALADLEHNLADVLQAIRAAGHRPVVVIDDTDRYARRGDDGGLDTDSIRALFENGVPPIAKVDVDLVIAVHPRYDDVPAYRQIFSRYGFTSIAVPELPVTGRLEPRPLARVLARRMERAGLDADVGTVISAPAIAALESLYVDHASDLRHVLNVASAAATEACDTDAEVIEDVHVFVAQRSTGA
jgi:AAA ATPase-like protein